MGGGGSVKPPPVPPPAPIPRVSDKSADQVIGESKRRSGYEKTLITGNLVSKNTGKKTTLG